MEQNAKKGSNGMHEYKNLLHKKFVLVVSCTSLEDLITPNTCDKIACYKIVKLDIYMYS